MWCSTCQQDVPSLGPTEGGGEARCSKCGEAFRSAISPPAPSAVTVVTSASGGATAVVSKAGLRTLLTDGPLADGDWALEAELRGVQRLVGSLKSRSTLVAEPMALHAPHARPTGWHATPHSTATSNPTDSDQATAHERTRHNPHRSTLLAPDKQPAQSHAAAWVVLSIGLAVFACGAVLLVWSLAGQRDDLWPVGMPLALIGQAGLILGLILQLDGLWHTSHKTAAALSELDTELESVRQATTLLSTSHSGGAQSFYMHLAEGASPQLLLTDLKGQLDLLAQQMARGK